MSMTETRAPVAAGEPAPDFTLPAIDGAGTVSLADYRGRGPVFLALLVGLWCPFCRRQIAQMGASEGKLKALGVETLGVVATAPENARLYFKFRPTRLRLGADPDLSTHRAYGVPQHTIDAGFMEALGSIRINPTGELPEPLPIKDAATALGQMDGYTGTLIDHAEMQRQMPQLKSQFLIDRDGIVRWANIECAGAGLVGVGKFPSEQEILAAVRSMLH